ncbi:hypothetical protein [Microbacterium sp. SORGH_AS_0888]|uniref:hypothetical protein n=1 Tax=Microbacterium sp. SORGH_AS_0888 TaxID=3041791 RepID=UPI0027821D8C|nr:hypothetical protein [Microbacterium sp. SORGH_AS_0888]MDQ1129856.1 hypothetical protein [Microbacterium sp. SORGH_AS_0888]
MSPDAADELAELRRRAYGPDADIDAVALARLRDMEAGERARSAPRDHAAGAPAPTAPVSDGARAGARPPAEPPRPAATSGAPETPDAGATVGDASAAAGGGRGLRLSRRVRAVWAASLVLAAALGAGVAAGAVVFSGWDPIPHAARLTPQDEGGVDRFMGSQDVELRSFGTYLGLGVYAGGGCLQVVFGGEGGRSGTGTCAGSGLATVLDVTVPADGSSAGGYGSTVPLPAELTERYPDGATVRFTHRGDVVVVDVGGLPDI